MEAVDRFVDQWTDDAAGVKPVFNALLGELQKQAGTELEFRARPGISYSLRGRHARQSQRPLFVMIDVIDDDPGQRWLSVCFYGDMIGDPEERGDLIPDGLLGSDGYCFDISEADGHLATYVGERVREAYRNAGSGR